MVALYDPSSTRPLRVLIADRHARFRTELAGLLDAQPGFSVVDAAADGATALALFRAVHPDVAVLDAELAMSRSSGTTPLAEMLDEWPDAAVLVLSGPAGAAAGSLARGAGARGHVAKDVDPQLLVEAIAFVARGGTVGGEPNAPSFAAAIVAERTFFVAFSGDASSGAGDDRERAAGLNGVRHLVVDLGGEVALDGTQAVAAIFADPLDALTAAAQIAERFDVAADRTADGSQGRSSAEPALLGIGIVTGRTDPHAGPFGGLAASRAAKLARAAPGRVLASVELVTGLGAALPPWWSVVHHGLRRLPGFGQARPVLELRLSGQPPARSPLGGTEPADAAERITINAGLGSTDASAAAAELSAVITGEREAAVLSRAQARALASRPPADVRDYHLGLIAAALARRDRSDPELVRLSLLVDQGEETADGRWRARDERYDTLDEILETGPDAVLVVLGEPGAGKSTLLWQLAQANAVAGAQGRTNRICLLTSLDGYRPEGGQKQPPEPGAWLARRWAERCPDLPPLSALLGEGRMLLLLDGLNEIPVRSQAERRRSIEAWRRFCVQLTEGPAGNQVVISCRRLDYSQPLSSAELRVPQVQIEPLDDDRVRDYLEARAPLRWRSEWARLAERGDLAMLRTAFFLHLFARQLEAGFGLPDGRAALSTAVVRAALRRQIEARTRRFDGLLDEPDRLQLATDRWASATDLPENGPLIGSLSRLAHHMQGRLGTGEAARVRLGLEDALATIAGPVAEGVLRAGEALNVLDRDARTGDVMFRHQLVQEYFAARELARAPQPGSVAAPWRVDDIRPRVRELLDSLPPSEALPALPTTGWEEATLLAAEMAAEPESFVGGLMAASLALAGRAAHQSAVRSRLGAAFLDTLRWKLVDRSRDPAADLRDRIACALSVGDLGDPRFERRVGPHGDYLLPPLVAVPGGSYPIGDDEPIAWRTIAEQSESRDHIPLHYLDIARFQIGRMSVTNAEWALFIAAGGYEDERWWDTPLGRAWRSGELANDGTRRNTRRWWRTFRADPPLFDRLIDEGRFGSGASIDRWRTWLQLSEAEFERELDDEFRPRRLTEPHHWRDDKLNRPTQPVVGVSWYEARAYCTWLAAQTGWPVRLPTEVEWEAAARGLAGRRFAWGDAFDPLKCNLLETQLLRTAPVGVFPEGDTPDGISDLTGNSGDWTSSAIRQDGFECSYCYPYDPTDGRERADAPADMRRVVRGGGWQVYHSIGQAAYRDKRAPDARSAGYGFRIVVAGDSPGIGARST